MGTTHAVLSLAEPWSSLCLSVNWHQCLQLRHLRQRWQQRWRRASTQETLLQANTHKQNIQCIVAYSVTLCFALTAFHNLITRKPGWCKGKHVTTVQLRRPLAKKSTANQRYATSYRWLIVTVALLLAACEILSRTEVEKMPFSQTVFWL